MKSLNIVGRRWFQKTYGNTYHSVAVEIDGEYFAGVDFAYGYGNQYLQTAQELLEKAGKLPDLIKHDNGGSEGLRFYCQRKGIIYTYSVTDVERKKGL